MDLTLINTYVELLTGLGVDMTAILAKLDAWKAANPSIAPSINLVEGWLRDHIGNGVVDALAKNAAPELVSLIQSGHGPISQGADPVDFA